MHKKESSFTGIGISPGVGIGKPILVEKKEARITKKKLGRSQVENEVQRFKKAIETCQKELKVLYKSLGKECTKESRAILESQMQLLDDHSFQGWVHQEIVEGRRRAEFAFISAVKAFSERFANLDPFFQERFKDFQVLIDKILQLLQSSEGVLVPSYPQGAVVFTQELSAFDVAEGIRKKVAAFVTAKGGATSHACIMARAQKIPVVTAIEFFHFSSLMKAKRIAVDGTNGKVYECFEPICAKSVCTEEKNCLCLLAPAVTADGVQVSLSANVDSPAQAEEVFKKTKARIGLFRSEFAFIGCRQFPSEAVQVKKYLALIKAVQGHEVVVRTFDIGGDKRFFFEAQYAKQRSFKFFLQEKTFFTKQVQAVLRASLSGSLKLLLPMITCFEDFLDAKEIVHREAKKLSEKLGVSVAVPAIGAMIETPSAALISDLLAKEADFLSIGTNDLAQYCLAIDRQDSAFQQLHIPSHPSIIRLIKMVVENAAREGIPVSVCGEMASNPRFTALLLGLGVNDLSVSPSAFAEVKRVIHSLSIRKAEELAEQVLKLSDTGSIFALLEQLYKKLLEMPCRL